METADKYIIGFLLFVVIAAIVIMVLKTDKDYYIYEGLYGDFTIDPFEIGNVTLYNVHLTANGRRYVVPLRNSPEAVEDIYLENNIVSKLNKEGGISMLYITKDADLNNKTQSKASLAVIEFGKILGTNEYGLYQINSKSAFTEDISDGITPVVTCSNITTDISVIYLKLGDGNKVYSKDQCVIIEGKDGDGLLMAADKFSYHLLGIM